MSKKAKQQKETKTPRAKRFDGLLEDGAIRRSFKGVDHMVVVKDCRLEYNGTLYGSLTAIAQKITGYKAISGPDFFGLTKKAVSA
jgi:hypothetical protein